MILNDLADLLTEVVILKSEYHYDTLALWIAHTYAMSEFDFTPRLGVWSPEKRCGKSLLLEIISYLVPESLMSSSISSAGIYRTIEKYSQIVILIDESDTVFGRNGDKEKSEALRNIMNVGFKRGVTIIRCEPPTFEPKKFGTFCPMVVAGIGNSAIPQTVADRSILIEMKRKTPLQSIREFESDEVEEIFRPIRERLDDWTAHHSKSFRSSRPQMPPELNSRERDVWKPLYKIAEAAGEEWKAKARLASIALSIDSKREDEESLPLQLLSDIRQVFVGEQMTTKDLLAALKAEEEAPWPHLVTFNAHFLSRMLRDYRIQPRPFSGGKIRGYYRKSFEDAWSRYLPATVTTVTTVTTIESQVIL